MQTLAGPGFFTGFTVTPGHVEGWAPDPAPDETACDDRYVRRWQLSPFSKLAENQAPVYADLPDDSAKWVPLNAERDGLIDVSRVYASQARARKAPDGRLSLENCSLMLPLKAGDNELAVALVDNFYCWGIKMRLDDVKDLVLSCQ